ncbi:uncharacterized protein OCT59_008592 [Rhizophagus irregularis]|uniref:uncharacterized protein n=1 Tax=Rhizophagus irregularis TaxID=588596 RepID=UPI00331A14FC|nr:hypothetical protein OCT59_008592 [Rhizophagus irregularis]
MGKLVKKNINPIENYLILKFYKILTIRLQDIRGTYYRGTNPIGIGYNESHRESGIGITNPIGNRESGIGITNPIENRESGISITNPIGNRYNESHRESGIGSDRCIYRNFIRNLLQPGYRIPDKISVLVVFLILYF